MSILLSYFKFGLDFFILKKDKPFILGLVITDKCNLSCKHCRVANVRRQHMPFEKIFYHLRNFYKRGARLLYLEGGEPYLWAEGEKKLDDIIKAAKDIGYLRAHIYSNGTLPLEAKADFTWVSIDGLPETHQFIRGAPLDNILDNIRNFSRRVAIIFTVNSLNFKEILPFLEFINRSLPGKKVMFFFHTPYYGFDSLLLPEEDKLDVIKTLISAKRRGLPVLNSVSALQAIAQNEFEHPTNLWYVVDDTGEYQCCRAYGKPEVCQHCGYSSCAEITLARSLNLRAAREMMRVF